MNNPTLPKDLRDEVSQQISFAIQGVAEMPHLPKVEIGDSKGIAKNMNHYYKQRAKWVDETTDSILTIVRTKLIEEINNPDKMIIINCKKYDIIDYSAGYRRAKNEVLSVIKETLK